MENGSPHPPLLFHC